MPDVFDTTKRSYIMSRIRSKDTKPELIVRKFLFSQGFRYRLNQKNLPGKPDIVLKKYNKVIFINGCFWHGHKNCKYFRLPKTRSKWWKEKIERNTLNDKINNRRLSKLGYKIITVWECKLKDKLVLNNLISKIKKQ